MKKFKKLLAFGLALIMCLGMAVTASAATSQEVATGKGGSGVITIENASKGQKYTVYKIFDATYVEGTADNVTSINYVYNGDKWDDKNEFFTKDSRDNRIEATAKAYEEINGAKVLTDGAVAYLRTLVDENAPYVNETEADGRVLKFTGLDYGYYMVTSDLNGGAAVAIDSTNKEAVMREKNTKEPGWTPDPDDPNKNTGKTVKTGVDESDPDNVKDVYGKETDANIGETVTFRLNASTQNFNEEGKRITSYIFNDNALQNNFIVDKNSVEVWVDGNKIEESGYQVELDEAAETFTVTVDWVDENGTSKYVSGVSLQVVYNAKLDTNAVIAGNGNKNTATFAYTVVNPDGTGEPETITKTETTTATVYTYALAIKKINSEGQVLKGAEFNLGSLYVVPVEDSTSEFVVVDSETEGAVNAVTTDDTGVIVIKGVKAGSYTITEAKAPTGYNKIEDEITVEAVVCTKTDTTEEIKVTIDAKTGEVVSEDATTEKITTTFTNEIPVETFKVVLNRTGSLLPSTGGIGTTIFYVVGGLLVAGAGVLLITKKRMKKEQ